MSAFDHMTADEFERQVLDPATAEAAALDAEISLMESLIAHMDRCPHATAGEALDCEAKAS